MRVVGWIVVTAAAAGMAGCDASADDAAVVGEEPNADVEPLPPGLRPYDSSGGCAYGASGNAGDGWTPLAPTLTEPGEFTLESCRAVAADYGNAKACRERSDIIVFKYKFWWSESATSDIVHGNFKGVDMTCDMSIEAQLALMSYDILPGPGQPALDCASQPAGIAAGAASWEELGVDQTTVATRAECEAFAIDRARARACEQRSDIVSYRAKAWFADPVAGLQEIPFDDASCGG